MSGSGVTQNHIHTLRRWINQYVEYVEKEAKAEALDTSDLDDMTDKRQWAEQVLSKHVEEMLELAAPSKHQRSSKPIRKKHGTQ